MSNPVHGEAAFPGALPAHLDSRAPAQGAGVMAYKNILYTPKGEWGSGFICVPWRSRGRAPPCGCPLPDLGVRDSGFGFGMGFRVSGLVSGVLGLGFEVWGWGFGI